MTVAATALAPQTDQIERVVRGGQVHEGELDGHVGILMETYAAPQWINYKSKPLQVQATIVVTACSFSANGNVQGMVTAEADRIVRDLQAEGLACEYHKAGAGQQAMYFNVRMSSSMCFIWVKA